jgi:hypothetical protein
MFRSLFVLSFVVILGFSSCKKMGCRDAQAINFEDGIKKDDGSCVYTGTLTVWFSQFQSSNYLAAGQTDLVFIVNNDSIGSIPTTNFANFPTCGMANTFTKVFSIGKVPTKDYTLIIRDDQDNFVSKKSFTLTGNGCLVIQVP